MVSELQSRSRDPGSSPGRGHCVVFLGKTLYSHSAFLCPGVLMDTSKLSGKPDRMLGGTCDRLVSHPGGVPVLLVASCHRN